MFTGIIEDAGIIRDVKKLGENRTFQISSALAPSLKIDQSLAHNGVCLTVEAINGNQYQVTAVAETLAKTNASFWKPGDYLNLERAMLMNGRLDGHLVQGHVDTTGIVSDLVVKDGSWEFAFQFPEEFAPLIIEKGSIAINGVSLTAWDVAVNAFKVAIIPYTFHHTNFQNLRISDQVNLEFDLIGKYLERSRSLRTQ